MRKTGMTRERQSWKASDGTVDSLQAAPRGALYYYPLFALVYPPVLVSHLHTPLISVISIRSMCIYIGAPINLYKQNTV